MLNAESIMEQEPASVLMVTKAILSTNREVVDVNAKRTANVLRNLRASEISVLILALEHVAHLRFAKSKIMFHYALVRLDSREIRSTFANKNLSLHHHERILACPRHAAPIRNAEKLMDKLFALVHPTISEVHLTVVQNAL